MRQSLRKSGQNALDNQGSGDGGSCARLRARLAVHDGALPRDHVKRPFLHVVISVPNRKEKIDTSLGSSMRVPPGESEPALLSEHGS